MKLGKVTKVLAALFVGAMMLQPATALAGTADHPEVTPGSKSVTGFSVEANESGYVTAKWGNKLTDDEYLYVEYSTDEQFKDDDKLTDYTTIGNWYDDNQCTLGDMDAGKTYYVRAFIREEKETYTEDYGYSYDYKYGPYSAVQKVTVPAPEVGISEQKVTNSSVYFNFGYTNSSATGFEIWRAEGSKYKKIAKISDSVFEDTGLDSAKVYNYRIRSYVYDTNTKKTVYSDWTYVSKMTWGSSLRFMAVPASNSSVKLSWKKVSGVSGYEIYRSVSGTVGTMASGGYTNNFSGYKLIKTIKKAGTTSYTDKKLPSGATYSYMIVAYKNKAGKKVRNLTLTGYDSATLDLMFSTYNSKENKDGSIDVKWKKVIGADGIKVQKYDNDEDEYKDVTTLKASTTSYTLPKAAVAGGSDEYRFCAYKGSEKVNSESFYTHNYSNYPAAPGNIKAVATNGGTAVQISWKAVAGADYYRVYRSRRLEKYDPDMDNYGEYPSYEEEVEIQTTDQPYGTSQIKTTSVTDQYVKYQYGDDEDDFSVVNEGPKLGLTYYYYVRAYKRSGQPVDEDDDYYDYENSMLSKPAKITLSAKALKAPKLSSVKSKKKGQATVSWKKASGAKQYYVYCSTKKGSGYKLAGITKKTSLTVKSLKSGTKYYFKVKSCTENEVGADKLSGFSGQKSVKVK